MNGGDEVCARPPYPVVGMCIRAGDTLLQSHVSSPNTFYTPYPPCDPPPPLFLLAFSPPPPTFLSRCPLQVLHIPDVDYHSSCVTLTDCLQAIRMFSLSHPSHLPIVLHLEVPEVLPTEARPYARQITAPLPVDQAVSDKGSSEWERSTTREGGNVLKAY